MVYVTLEEYLESIGLDMSYVEYIDEYTEITEGKLIDKLKKKKNERKEDNYFQKRISDIQKRTNHKNEKTVKFENIFECNVVKTLLNRLHHTNSFHEYSSYFKKFCDKLHIPDKDVVVTKCKFKGNNKDGYSADVGYATSPIRVIIPQGYSCYHKTTQNGLKELKPFYCGKSAMGYIYDKPRIYFTIKKNMNNFAADISVFKGKKADQKTHLYVIDEPVRTAYIDPLLKTYMFGAFYIETDVPVKVKQIY